MNTALKQLIDSATEINDEELRAMLAGAQVKEAAIRAQLKSLRPIQAIAINQLEDELAATALYKTQIEGILRHGACHRLLSLKPLEQRDERGFPCLVPFDLEHAIACIGIKPGSWKMTLWTESGSSHIWTRDGKIPEIFSRQYLDLRKRLENRSRLPRVIRDGFRVRYARPRMLCYCFGGVISEAVDRRIKDAEKADLDVYLIVGAKQGAYSTYDTRQLNLTDTRFVVVGIDEGNQVWLVDSSSAA